MCINDPSSDEHTVSTLMQETRIMLINDHNPDIHALIIVNILIRNVSDIYNN
jgi:hypothetical protein